MARPLSELRAEQEREAARAISDEHRAKAARIAERLIDEMDRVTSDSTLLPQMPSEVFQCFADAIDKFDRVSRGRGGK